MRKWFRDWQKLNPILADGEVGEIIGMTVTKTGDGKTPWRNLSYTPSPTVDSDPFDVTLTDAEADATSKVEAAKAYAVQRSNHTGVQTSTTISDFTEAVQDAVALLLGAGTNITVNYDDVANTLTIATTAADAEAVRDAIGIALVGVGNISIGVNDALDTITISTTATVNATDAALRDRSTHTGTQLSTTISDFSSAAVLSTKDIYASAVATALGSKTGVVDLDASVASTWTVTATGDLTLNFINVPTTKAFEPLVVVKQGGSGGYTVSFSQNSTIISPQWDTLLAPTAVGTVGAETSFSLFTSNGGATWSGAGATPAPATNMLLPTDFPPLQAWTAPPNLVAASKQPVAGVMWCTKLKAPAGASLSKLWYYLSTAATAPTNSYLAVYDTAGNRLSVSANLSSTDFLGSQSTFRGTSMPAFTVPADGVLIIAVLVGAATVIPTFSALQNSNAAGNAIAQDGSKGYGVFSYGSALTAMPATLTLNSTNCVTGAQAIMFGVS